MAFDPERFAKAVKAIIDTRLGGIEARLNAMESLLQFERRVAALEAGHKGISATVTRALTDYQPARAYQAGDTVIIPQEGSIYKARRYTQGLEHPRFSPMSWERLA